MQNKYVRFMCAVFVKDKMMFKLKEIKKKVKQKEVKRQDSVRNCLEINFYFLILFIRINY